MREVVQRTSVTSTLPPHCGRVHPLIEPFDLSPRLILGHCLIVQKSTVIRIIFDPTWATAVPESLKNMLLVMDTAGIFSVGGAYGTQAQAPTAPSGVLGGQGGQGSTPLWELTWDKLDAFLPHLMKEVFGDR